MGWKGIPVANGQTVAPVVADAPASSDAGWVFVAERRMPTELADGTPATLVVSVYIQDDQLPAENTTA